MPSAPPPEEPPLVEPPDDPPLLLDEPLDDPPLLEPLDDPPLLLDGGAPASGAGGVVSRSTAHSSRPAVASLAVTSTVAPTTPSARGDDHAAGKLDVPARVPFDVHNAPPPGTVEKTSLPPTATRSFGGVPVPSAIVPAAVPSVRQSSSPAGPFAPKYVYGPAATNAFA